MMPVMDEGGGSDRRTVGQTDEFELIRLLLEALGPQPEHVGLHGRMVLPVGDDACGMAPSPNTITLHTTDTMVEDVHFLKEMAPDLLGWKSLAANISDIAAMGGVPAVALVTVGASPAVPVSWLQAWYRGLGECARSHGMAVGGGDVVRMPAGKCFTVSLSGEVEPHRMMTRARARPGDRLIATGFLGDSAAGLALHLEGLPWPDSLRLAHLRPLPRVAEARAGAAAGGVTAMIDISDGLGGDVRHIGEASGVGAVIFEEALPISHQARETAAALGRSPLEFALSGGEDYELLLCVTPSRVQPVMNALASVGRVSATVIGEITADSNSFVIRDSKGVERALPTSFRHFHGS